MNKITDVMIFVTVHYYTPFGSWKVVQRKKIRTFLAGMERPGSSIAAIAAVA